MVFRGAFRLGVGFVLTVTVAWTVLWRLEDVLGPGPWISENVWVDAGLATAIGLLAGVTLAVAWDRVWTRIRGRGPRLTLKRR